MANALQCTHPARLRGKDGATRCLTCSAVIRPEKPKKGNDKTDDKAAE